MTHIRPASLLLLIFRVSLGLVLLLATGLVSVFFTSLALIPDDVWPQCLYGFIALFFALQAYAVWRILIFRRHHRMRRWILVMLGALGSLMLGSWLGLYDDLRMLPGWADILIGSPVAKITGFLEQALFHAQTGFLFRQVAVLYCASIGALLGFGSSFLFSRRTK